MKHPKLLLAAAALITPALLVGGGVALATHDDPNVLHACVQGSSGLLRLVDSPNDCRATERLVEWGITGPPGPHGETGEDGRAGPAGEQGPPGVPGGLACEDEYRINDALPGFGVSPECGLVTIATGLTENGGYNNAASNYVETAPYGNPPGRHDVAHPFTVLGTDHELEYLDLAVGIAGEIPTALLSVQLVGDMPGDSGGTIPDLTNILETWSVGALTTPGADDPQVTVGPNAPWGLRLTSRTGVRLKADTRYWVVLSVDGPARYRWWTGDFDVIQTNPARRERYDFGCSVNCSPGPWTGGDTGSGPGSSAGLRVLGSQL